MLRDLFDSNVKSYNIDLRNSLWCSYEEGWNNDPDLVEAFETLKDSFNGSQPPVLIRSAPWKVIRYGKVLMSEKEATVDFCTVWDTPEELVPEDCPEELFDEVASSIDFYLDEVHGFYDETNPMGAQIIETVKSDSFGEIMELIDNIERDLVVQETKNEEALNQYVAEVIANLQTGQQ